jgi:hypothetical protein
MLEFTGEEIRGLREAHAADSRLSTLLAHCAEIGRGYAEATARLNGEELPPGNYPEDGGMLYIIAMEAADLVLGGPLAVRIRTSRGDVLRVTLLGSEHCFHVPGGDFYELTLNVSEDAATCLLVPEEILSPNDLKWLSKAAAENAAAYAGAAAAYARLI